jgi:2-polyprenyl-3-methyl-5-hydroxy-6-metoxy-1,4-benzoquinol methylase
MHQLSDEQVLHSWAVNAPQWTTAVRDGLIESRPLVTNQAITGAVLECSPDSVIDLGCGEGWLVRQLGPWVRRLVGVDAIPALVDQARAAGGGEFIAANYAEIEAGRMNESFDVAVCNFSLLGDNSVENIVRAMPLLLKPSGRVIVQTLHPFLLVVISPTAMAGEPVVGMVSALNLLIRPLGISELLPTVRTCSLAIT